MSKRVVLAALSAAILAAPAALAETEADALCPRVAVQTDANKLIVYPPGGPSGSRHAFAYIATVLNAAAFCREGDDGEIVADIAVQLAMQAGSAYRGGATVEVFSIMMQDGITAGEFVRNRQVVELDPAGRAKVARAVLQGLYVGKPRDLRRAPDYQIVVGLEPLTPPAPPAPPPAAVEPSASAPEPVPTSAPN